MTSPEELEAELWAKHGRELLHLDTIAALRAERDEARKETKLRQAALTARARSMSKLRAKLVQITDHIEDEGDGRYFGSTNHADELMEIFHDLDAWNWEAIMRDGKLPDPYETSRKAIARAEAAEAREGKLRAALEKIATMDVRPYIQIGDDPNECGPTVMLEGQFAKIARSALLSAGDAK